MSITNDKYKTDKYIHKKSIPIEVFQFVKSTALIFAITFVITSGAVK